jgi:(p)ppGpp synthase/HD superfamily hydrolase
MDNQNMTKVSPDKKKAWSMFLINTRKKGKNREVLSNYFFEEFKNHKEEFFDFLNALQKEIHKESAKNQKILAERYLNILSPLCDRFGVHALKRELDDICFKITNPKEYEEISKKLKIFQAGEQIIIDKITEKLHTILKETKIDYELIGRYKTIHSIYTKIIKKEKEVLKLKDIFGFRIIVNNNNQEDCFEVLNILHDNFMPITEFFKDYITIPKINGYQSLHTGLTKVIDDLDIPIEVQIRTKTMHEFSQNGLAAHWIYAKDKKSKLRSEKEQKVLDHFSKMEEDAKKGVYFFSQDNDIYILDDGATILDFAYRIHSGLGNKTKSAKVGEKEVDIKYKIQTGDKIQINTSDKDLVHPDWLKIIKTKHARKQIEESIKY